MNLHELKYPVGEYQSNKNPDALMMAQWIKTIEAFPGKLRLVLDGVSSDALSWKYRPDGWTVKQVVHHCVDSHMNAMVRFKLALTEDNVTIRPYNEKRWAELIDAQEDNLEPSLLMLQGLHIKLGQLLRSLTKDQLQLELKHPEYGNTYRLGEYVGNYAWHRRHHLAHVEHGLASQGRYN